MFYVAFGELKIRRTHFGHFVFGQWHCSLWSVDALKLSLGFNNDTVSSAFGAVGFRCYGESVQAARERLGKRKSNAISCIAKSLEWMVQVLHT